jgi:hypothetical protein
LEHDAESEFELELVILIFFVLELTVISFLAMEAELHLKIFYLMFISHQVVQE